jgi:hypothetical protein
MKNINLMLSFLSLFLMLSCQDKSDEEIKPGNQLLKTKSYFYFKATVNKVPTKMETTFFGLKDDTVYNRTSGSTGNQGFSNTGFHHASHIGDERANSRQELVVHLAQYIDNKDLFFQDFLYRYKDSIQFQNVFAVGPRNFSNNLSERNGAAVAIEYRDPNGKAWTSSYNVGDQISQTLPKVPTYAGHTFNIVSSIPHKDLSNKGNKLQLVKINFDCYLYDSAGDSIHVENGEFQGLMECYWLKK